MTRSVLTPVEFTADEQAVFDAADALAESCAYRDDAQGPSTAGVDVDVDVVPF